MHAILRPGVFSGTVRIPGSKSHTIRRLLFASLAKGVSVLDHPLDSLDARSCVDICKAFGAEIVEERAPDGQDGPVNANPADSQGKRLVRWVVRGIGVGSAGAGAAVDGATIDFAGAGAAQSSLRTPENVLDVGNSGTSLYLALAVAALGSGCSVFTGDGQIRRRSAAPLLEALQGLGAKAFSTRDNGCAPIVVQGPWKGGRVSIPCPTSQYLSALLIAAPLAAPGTVTELDVPLLNERPYVEMTLAYLDAQGVQYEAAADRSYFRILGGSAYHPMNGTVPGDFSSAAFPACAAAISGGTVDLLGLDPADTQGDKAVFDHLALMGCGVEWRRIAVAAGPDAAAAVAPAAAAVHTAGAAAAAVHTADLACIASASAGARAAGPSDIAASAGPAAAEWVVRVFRKGPLKPVSLDLNATPDALPALAATMCYAEGQSYLRNVPNARIKETDRIAVMASELSKLGVAVQELSDGLSITGRAASAPSAAVTVGRIVGGLAAVPAPVAPAPASVASFGSAGFPGSSGFSGSSGFLRLQGHGDHRVVMALAIAALGADRLGEEPAARTISIDTAESAAVTYPGFLQLLGASMVEDSTQ